MVHLSSKHFAHIDDISTLIALEPHFGFRVHQIFRRKRNKDYENRIIIADYIEGRSSIDECVDKIKRQVLPKPNLATELKKVPITINDEFFSQLKSYLSILNPGNDFALSEDKRMTDRQFKQLKVTSNRAVLKGEIIECRGLLAELTPTDKFIKIGVNDFSIIKKRGRENLLLGPLAFVNHSCDPNCYFVSESDNCLHLKTLKKIEPEK
jgi:hypothetical protein